MSEDIAGWQRDARRAFEWLERMYEQSQTIWEDAKAYLEDEGWKAQWGSLFGGTAYHVNNLREWPFVYFQAMGAWRPEEHEGDVASRGVFFGFVFYDGREPERRIGPTCVAGTVSWSNENAIADHWVLYAAVGGHPEPKYDGSFEVGAGPVHLSRATPKGKVATKGIEDVRWFEVPLGTVSSPERLREIVDAAIALHGGDEALARDVVTRFNVATST